MLNDLLIKELSDQVDLNTSDIQDIKDGEVYSTNEIKTNKIWINGKPIYRKVFDVNIDTSTVGWREVGSISFDEIINSNFVCNSSDEPTRYRPNNTYVNLSFYNGKCYAAGTGGWSSSTSLILKKVVVEYTKQTN